MFGFGRKIHRSVVDANSVEVSEVDGVRSLYLGSNTIQSSMRVKAPFDLVLAYSRGMMAFLLFTDEIRDVLMIGLGGGSVPKYIWQYCPDITQTIIEINPQITRIARSHFSVPENDARLNVIEGDGIEYLQTHLNSTQVLMIDAFDGAGIPPDFCTQAFFDDCEAALTQDGIFVINLWGSDKNFDIYWQRIERSFSAKVLKLPTGKPGNIIVFGFKKTPKELRIANLRTQAQQLALHHKIDYSSFVETLCEYNPNDKKQLILGSILD